ncbi:peptidoglycan editing factor PgeF [Palleronia caenipelagi]|uniref:Purine nucleoside phosphorylase n=1 Tax=Palleronia caenipelagi TaxID=2489174 RepID=A0A547Q9T9_9RHOB|nr:peptidoglycan editing factor PgeF [Palleronia caenipelagi]TRD23121.1 peptidoglycan editing factor PgeF [Palleronia caenipelagi]
MTVARLTSDLIPAAHGFYTRVGGASSGVFAGLNCGKRSSDQGEIVEINRIRVAEDMGVGSDHLLTVNQVHSPRAIVVREPSDTESVEADAMATATPGLALGILTADCMPILFSDPDAGVIGAAHGGWRGTLDGVIEATLDAMEQLGAQTERVHAVIGPCISQANYEVGPELFDSFRDEHPDYTQFFTAGQGDRMLFDLPGLGLYRLREAGVAEAEWIRHCTYADPARFFSYRRATHRKEADYGRLISVIRL